MQLVITPEESARLDASAAVPVGVLMDRAGYAVAASAVAMGAGYGSRVVILTGTGNNGGDGWVAARYLARRGVAVVVHSLGYPKGDYAPARLAAISAIRHGVKVRTMGAPCDADLVIDAVFGVGFRGTLPDVVAAWTDRRTPVLAVDVPSGLGAATGEVDGPCFTADRTVTFHALKPGHLLAQGPDRCGTIEVVDIGLVGGEPEFRVCDDDDAPRPARSRDAHKWSAGSVLVVGGSPGISGAAMMTATSALHGGAGAVTVAVPAQLEPLYAGMAAGVMTRGCGTGQRFDGSDAAEVLEAGDRYDVMILGPGLGRGTEDFVAAVVAGRNGKLLIDADGLNALHGTRLLEERTGPTVITPHAAEFSRLTGAHASYRSALETASRTGTVVVLKGGPTFVAGSECWAVVSGGPELATIGTGDVLGGLVGALWARGLSAEVAARSGAHWHGRAGAWLAIRETVTAEQLAVTIGRFAW